MILKMDGKVRNTTVSCGIDCHDVNSSLGEVTKGRSEDKRTMPDVTGVDLAADVNNGKSGICAKHLAFYGCHVMVAVSGVAKQGDDGHQDLSWAPSWYRKPDID